jgi:hypothetical protein
MSQSIENQFDQVMHDESYGNADSLLTSRSRRVKHLLETACYLYPGDCFVLACYDVPRKAHVRVTVGWPDQDDPECTWHHWGVIEHERLRVCSDAALMEIITGMLTRFDPNTPDVEYEKAQE